MLSVVGIMMVCCLQESQQVLDLGERICPQQEDCGGLGVKQILDFVENWQQSDQTSDFAEEGLETHLEGDLKQAEDESDEVLECQRDQKQVYNKYEGQSTLIFYFCEMILSTVYILKVLSWI